MTTTTKTLRAFDVRFYGPTNHKGARIRIRDLRGIIQRPLWIGFDYAYSSSLEQACYYLEALGWDIEAVAETPEGHLLLVADFRQETWEVRQ